MTAERILLVEDDDSLREVLTINLEDLGLSVDQASDAEEALSLFKHARAETPHALVISDIKMPKMSGLELLDRLRLIDPEVPVIMLTAFGGVERSLDAMRRGAFHYVEKPVNMSALYAEINRALSHRAMRAQVGSRPISINKPKKPKLGESESRLVAASPAMNDVLKVVDRVAGSDAPVMILGESGVGKELIARALHERSDRAQGPWVTVNCAAIPSELLESVLFGYERGAFTGAHKRSDGKFSLADGGTLFLDEIAEMSPELQAKLLRVLQDGLVERIGATVAQSIDVRIVTATHQDLALAMERGSFRRDLYYRLYVIPLTIPPLRDRSEDIPVLLRHFIRELAPQDQIRVSESVDQACLQYAWPGNVRELRNIVERTLLLRESDAIELSDLPLELQARADSEQSKSLHSAHVSLRADLSDTQELDTREERVCVALESINFDLPQGSLDLRELEKRVILSALELHRGNRSATARYLKIPRHTLLYRLEKIFAADNSS